MKITTFQDENQAYAVLPFITIVIYKNQDPVLFKIGKIKRYCDYEAFSQAIQFFYRITQKGKEHE